MSSKNRTSGNPGKSRIDSIAFSSLLFQGFDSVWGNIEYYLEPFKFHCKVHELKEDKQANLLLASLDGGNYGKLQNCVSSQRLSEIMFEQLKIGSLNCTDYIPSLSSKSETNDHGIRKHLEKPGKQM